MIDKEREEYLEECRVAHREADNHWTFMGDGHCNWCNKDMIPEMKRRGFKTITGCPLCGHTLYD